MPNQLANTLDTLALTKSLPAHEQSARRGRQQIAGLPRAQRPTPLTKFVDTSNWHFGWNASEREFGRDRYHS